MSEWIVVENDDHNKIEPLIDEVLENDLEIGHFDLLQYAQLVMIPGLVSKGKVPVDVNVIEAAVTGSDPRSSA